MATGEHFNGYCRTAELAWIGGELHQKFVSSFYGVPDKWVKVERVPEPPKEPTQGEDLRAMDIAWLNYPQIVRPESGGFSAGWFAALKYERGEILKIVSKLHPIMDGHAIFESVRKRCQS